MVDYKGVKTKVLIICRKHGQFKQTPEIHLNGSGCQKCGYEYNSKYFSLNVKTFIDRANKIHNSRYRYDMVEYQNMHIKVNIICKIHGVFKQTPNNHLGGKGCPICNESKGEKTIKYFLDEWCVDYVQEKTFDGCKNIQSLYYDFYLPNNNLLIEYDGKQHYIPIDFFGGENALEQRKINDKIKNEFAKNNNINLLRISFNDFNNIEVLLNKHIQF